MLRWLMRARSAVCVLACVLAYVWFVPPTESHAGANRPYVRTVPDQTTWEHYSRVHRADRFGKFIIDIKSGDIYFIDVNIFKLHADFVLDYLLELPWTADNIREYNENYELEKPRFILGYLTHHTNVDRWTFAFWSGDKISAKQIARVHRDLQTTFFIPNLTFRPDSPAQEKRTKQVERLGIRTITNDRIYKTARFQSFNTGRSVGRLRVVPPGTPYESLIFERSDIVLLQEVYPDIPPVSGIISTVFSTPLAHVNLRATAWGIPNAGYVDALSDYRDLDGKMVYLQVEDAQHQLRLATESEISALQRELRPTVTLPPADLENANLPMLTHIRVSDIAAYGAKTSNLGEVASARLPGVDVPSGFGVPFFYYVQHMRQHGLDARISNMLADSRFETDARHRKSTLEALREAIVAAPLDEAVLAALYKRVRVMLGGRGVFVRSSTNAEDLEGFNGAGLYDTVPNVTGKRPLGEAVKQVWASLWNYRAVEERSLFGIDHRSVYAGVLIQVGVEATAAGVLITSNLYDNEDEDGFTINAKWGLGMRVVQGTRVPEQIIFNPTNDGTRIISRSDDPVMLVFDENGGIREVPNEHQGVILTEDRAKRLCNVVRRFRPLFPTDYPLDVEWLFEGERVWIVQSRPYIHKPKR